MFQNLLSNLFKRSQAFLAELRRTSFAVFFVLLGAMFISKSGREIFHQQLGVLSWKLVLLGTSVIAAHVVRRQLFPYIDLSALLEEKSTAGATAFLAVAIVYAAIILSIANGL